MNDIHKDKASFRDPSGFIYYRKGEIYRQINKNYQKNYDHLMGSGLYQKLVNEKKLIEHTEVKVLPLEREISYKVIKPEEITFISYPYEWCFSQYKKTSLAVLDIQKTSLEFGMTLKDASAFNMQFDNSSPVLIDTLSFEIYQEGKPWVAYNQYCRHFLAPLLLMYYRDLRLNKLFRNFVDGVPLDLASNLLPNKTWLKIPILAHIHMHAKSQKLIREEHITNETIKGYVKKEGILGIVNNIENIINSLTLKTKITPWENYLTLHNYSKIAYQHKKDLVANYINLIRPETVWDFGANTGEFSRLASEKGIKTIAFDSDYGATEINYQKCIKDNEKNLLPLVFDLVNPSPGLGWSNEERKSIEKRGSPDLLMGLALVHHLAIGHNLPFELIGKYFSDITKWLVIEFIPKDDQQVKKLLKSREDISNEYSMEHFEKAFRRYFAIQDKKTINDSGRILYLMKKETRLNK